MPLAVSAPAKAADLVSEDEELALLYTDKATVSIATGYAQKLRRAPAVTSVVTAEDIAAMGAVDLDQVLETVPGLHVERISGPYAPVYVMRGIGGGSVTNPQVLLMQNGIPITSIYSGDRGGIWGGMAVENIARIEVIRGPGSALYGADAYAGVINIITRTAADTNGILFSIGGGAFNTWDTSLRYGGKLGGVDVAAYLHVGSTSGQKEIIKADAQTLNDARFGTRVSHAPGPVNTGYDAIDGNLDLAYGRWRLRSSYALRENLHTGAGVNYALDPNSTGKSARITSDLSWTDLHINQDWGVSALASFMHYKEAARHLLLLPAGARLGTNFFPDGVVGGPSRWQRQFRLSAHATYSGWRNQHWRIGVGHDDVNLYKASTFKNHIISPNGAPIPAGPQMDYSDIQPHITPNRRHDNYVYLQNEWQLARDWTLTAGLRHDQYSDFGGTSNPRFAVVWDADLDLTIKFLYGRAFRAPSFNEQYAINVVANGNRGLRPETIQTREIAAAWQARKDLQLNINAFQYTMQDIIRAVVNRAPMPGATYSNIGARNGFGMEMEATWDASRHLRLSAIYAYQRATDQATHQDAGYAPHHHYYARADWRWLEGWQLTGQINRVADRKRGQGDLRPDIADYTTVDLNLRSSSNRYGWTASVAIRNLFNADVREPSLAPGTALPDDLPMAGRAWYVQANYRF